MSDSPEPTSNRSRFWPRIPVLNFVGVAAVLLAAVLIAVRNLPDNTPNQLLNVSYDPTVEVYAALDKAFTQQYPKQTGVTLDIKESHGGSGRQARAVVDGTEKADVVSLALVSDIDIPNEQHGVGALALGRASLPEEETEYSATLKAVRYARTKLADDSAHAILTNGINHQLNPVLYYLV